jgi:hypothetical protein
VSPPVAGARDEDDRAAAGSVPDCLINARPTTDGAPILGLGRITLGAGGGTLKVTRRK